MKDSIKTYPLSIRNNTINQLALDSILTSTSLFRCDIAKAVVPPNDSIILPVQFLPNGYGKSTDTLLIKNNSQVPIFKISLTGISPQPALWISKTAVDFGEVLIDGTSARSFVLRDSTVNILFIDSIVTSHRFFIVTPIIRNVSIGLRDSVVLGISFRPDTVYQFHDTLSIVGNFQSSPVTIDLQGKGVTTITSANLAGLGIPMTTTLNQNYPNPFNPATTIRFGLPHQSVVTLTVYNTLGQKVAELVNGDIDAGYHSVQFDARNLASGVYIYRLQAGSFVETRKLLLIR